MSTAPDVQLVGNGTVLDFWAREQPADPRVPFSVEITLLPVGLKSPIPRFLVSSRAKMIPNHMRSL